MTALSPLSRRAGELVALDLETFLGTPAGNDAALVFGAQVRIETADGVQMYGNNPLNLRPVPGGWPGQVGVSPGGFAMFDTLESGARACAENYANGPEYARVRALLAWPAETLAAAIEQSPWDAGHYGPGNLVALVKELTMDQFVTKAEFEAYKVALQAQLDATYGPLLKHVHEPICPPVAQPTTGPIIPKP